MKQRIFAVLLCVALALCTFAFSACKPEPIVDNVSSGEEFTGEESTVSEDEGESEPDDSDDAPESGASSKASSSKKGGTSSKDKGLDANELGVRKDEYAKIFPNNWEATKASGDIPENCMCEPSYSRGRVLLNFSLYSLTNV